MAEAAATTAGIPVEQSGRRPTGELVVRVPPRYSLLALLGLVMAVVVGVLLDLSVQSSYFDGRIAWFVLVWIVWSVIGGRARLLVADRALWRTGLGVGRAVSLDGLASVTVRRARFWKQEGWGGRQVRVVDRFGRSIAWKPRSWHRGSEAVLTVLGTCAVAQGIELDEATSAYLQRARSSSAPAPAWAYRPARLAEAGDLAPAPIRRRRLRPRDLALSLGAVAIAIGFTVVAGKVGTDYLQGRECAPDRHLWTSDGDVGGVMAPASEMADRMTTSHLYGDELPNIRVLTADDLAYGDGDLIDGREATWGDPSNPDVVVRFEQFSSHDEAQRYLRRWAEWHCRRPETSLTLPLVPGSVGWVYDGGGRYDENKVSFVRGDTRVEIRLFDDRGSTTAIDRDAQYVNLTSQPR